MRRIIGLAAAALTLALAACGGADSQDKRGSTGTPASTSQSGIPEALQGTWQTTITSSRVVDAPDDLTEEQSTWRLKFLGTGGEDNGPSMFLSNEQVGEIVYSVSLSDDGITLQSDTDCRRFYYVELDMENLMIRSTEPDRGCPSTLISSVLQRPWRLVESGPSHEPTTAEGSLASKEAFADCARQRTELGIVVGFRDGRAVPEPGQDIGNAEIYTRVISPQGIAEALADGGQYVGLREGVDPDVDIVFHGWLPASGEDYPDSTLSRFGEEGARKGIVSTNMGDYSKLAGIQNWFIVRLEGDDPPGWDDDLVAPRVPRALTHLVPCFKEAVRAANRLVPAPGPLAGVWRTDPITVDDMTRTLRDQGLGKWVGRFERQAPIGKTPTALVLEIDTRDYLYPRDWHLYAEPGAGSSKSLIDPRVQFDDPAGGLRYEQDGDQVVATYEGDSNTYRWSVDGDYLTLTWQKTTYPDIGIPEEVFQRALYMTAKFKRVG
jgi:hypothetical protein